MSRQRTSRATDAAVQRHGGPGRVVVVGAGPAGLTAAYELAKRGATCTVLEMDDVVGGISRTVEREGWRFDIGGHRFFTKVPEVQNLWCEILGPEDFLLRRRLSRIYYEGTFYDYPIRFGQRAAWSRDGRVDQVRPLLLVGTRAPSTRPRHLRGLDGAGIRLASLSEVLQGLHREGVGDTSGRDQGGLGRAADQEPDARERR